MMAELLANVAIAREGGLPAPYFLNRWRATARSLPTWRPLPPNAPIHDTQANPTMVYCNLFKAVFGLAIDPNNTIVDGEGLPSKTHRADWRRIP